MIKYFAVFSIVACLLVSCPESQELKPRTYALSIRNDYFEGVRSVKLGIISIGEIEQGGTKSIFMAHGKYRFSCVTQSNLRITTEVHIQGVHEAITIKINKQGNVELV